MMIHDTQAAGRPTLTFRLIGLPSREQMLFKSFIRLIDHLTHQHWVPSEEGPADLVVASSDTVVPPHPPCLRLGADTNAGPHQLSLPLHADQLEREMNLLGDLIVLTQRKVEPAAASASSAASRASFAPGQALRLLRWPAPAVLRGTERLRLATMMSVRTFTPQGLREQSGVSAAALADFLADLAASGLLELVKSAPVAAPRPSVPAPLAAEQATVSLLARIRSRLGLTQTQSQP